MEKEMYIGACPNAPVGFCKDPGFEWLGGGRYKCRGCGMEVTVTFYRSDS